MTASPRLLDNGTLHQRIVAAGMYDAMPSPLLPVRKASKWPVLVITAVAYFAGVGSAFVGLLLIMGAA